MKYFHRTTTTPDDVIHHATRFFGRQLSPLSEGSRDRGFGGAIGQLHVSVLAEGGHYTLVTVETNQPGESEIDKLAKRFLVTVHQLAEPGYPLRGAY